MAKYTLIVMHDWKKRGWLFPGGKFKFVIKEKDMQDFIQTCYEKDWLIVEWR